MSPKHLDSLTSKNKTASIIEEHLSNQICDLTNLQALLKGISKQYLARVQARIVPLSLKLKLMKKITEQKDALIEKQ